MTLIEALSFIDSEIMTRKDYGMKLAAKVRPETPESVLQLERNRLQSFYALREALKSGLIGEMNGQQR